MSGCGSLQIQPGARKDRCALVRSFDQSRPMAARFVVLVQANICPSGTGVASIFSSRCAECSVDISIVGAIEGDASAPEQENGAARPHFLASAVRTVAECGVFELQIRRILPAAKIIAG